MFVKKAVFVLGVFPVLALSCSSPQKNVSCLEEVVKPQRACVERKSVYLDLENVVERGVLVDLMNAVLEQYPVAEGNVPLDSPRNRGLAYGIPYYVWCGDGKFAGYVEICYATFTPDPRVPDGLGEKKSIPLNVHISCYACEDGAKHLKLSKVFFAHGFPFMSVIDVPLEKFKYVERITHDFSKK